MNIWGWLTFVQGTGTEWRSRLRRRGTIGSSFLPLSVYSPKTLVSLKEPSKQCQTFYLLVGLHWFAYQDKPYHDSTTGKTELTNRWHKRCLNQFEGFGCFYFITARVFYRSFLALLTTGTFVYFSLMSSYLQGRFWPSLPLVARDARGLLNGLLAHWLPGRLLWRSSLENQVDRLNAYPRGYKFWIVTIFWRKSVVCVRVVLS